MKSSNSNSKPIKQLILLFFIITFCIKGQVNLVPNPSFETYTMCPDYAARLYYTSNWYMPTQATSDFFNTCAFATATPTYYSVWVPNNFGGYQKLTIMAMVTPE